jgi:ubiquinone biosynthesis protein UbiJ
MDALQAILRPAVDILNRNIPEVTRARELCAELSGTTAAIRVHNTGLAAYFKIHDDTIELADDIDGDGATEPDIGISGSLLALARVAANGDETAIRDGSIELTGDAETAQAFQELLSVARPDLEEGVSRLVGDSAAHQLGELGRGLQRWASDAGETMSANLREYLQEESGDAPSRYEVDRFTKKVGTLRDDVERLAARVRRLKERGE